MDPEPCPSWLQITAKPARLSRHIPWVNNAGVERLGTIEETPLADFRTCIETNYFGAIRCIQLVISPMRERKSVAIINTSSIGGKISLSPMGPYCASKFALEAVTEALAQELQASGVRVAIVQP